MIEDINYNTLQEEWSKELDFNDLYKEKPGDIIYTLDVIYREEKAFVGCDILSYPDNIIATEQYVLEVKGKYTPGYFSFYEGPILLDAIALAKEQFPKPQLVIVDGHGLAHPRKFGLACYVGLKLNLPTIGFAKKSLLPYSGFLGENKGSLLPIKLVKEKVGTVLRTQTGVKPIFISVGNKIDLKTSIKIAKELTGNYRIPENIRRADQMSRKVLS